MRKYSKPTMDFIAVESGILATSGELKYTNDNASNEHEALAGDKRGDWGSLWK